MVAVVRMGNAGGSLMWMMGEGTRDRWGRGFVVAGALLVLACALVPAITPTTPIVFFDVDPRSELGRTPAAMMGPVGLAWLQVVTVLAAAVGFAAVGFAGGRVRGWWVALAGAGVTAAMLQMTGSTSQWIVAGAWASSACLGVAGAHLARHERARAWMAAGLIAMLAPLAISAAYYVLVEHPMTVDVYLQQRDDWLASRGWMDGSPQALAFERRLQDPAAVGAYGFSNIFGSVVGALTLLGAGVVCFTAGAAHTGRERWGWWAGVLAAGAGVAAVALARSKGASAAAVAGGVLLGVVWVSPRLRLPKWLPAAVAGALIGAAVLAVLARGWMGPPQTWEGERSLYFRWQYWGAAVRVLGEAGPREWLLGVGPEAFRAAYERLKDPFSPEEITSTHSVFVDWIVMLGVGGAAWAALLLHWLLGSRPLRDAGVMVQEDVEEVVRPIVGMVAIAAVVFGACYVARRLWLGSMEGALVWLAGLVAFACVMVFVLPLHVRRSWAIAPAAFAAGGVVLIHAQIEMTFFQAASLPLVWLVLGMAGGSGKHDEEQSRGRGALYCAGGLGLLALVMAVLYAVPMTGVQSHLQGAAEALQLDRRMAAIERLDEAGRLTPADASVLEWRVRLRMEEVADARGAGQREAVERLLASAFGVLDRGHRVEGPLPHRLRAGLCNLAAEALQDSRYTVLAAEALEDAMRKSPYNLRTQQELAALYDQLGRTEQATQAYRRALQLSDEGYLDPVRQLTPAERAAIELRLAALSG